MTNADSNLANRLSVYAADLRQSGAIRTDAVEAAFATVPRHRFLPRFHYRGVPFTLDPSSVPADDVLDIIYANNSLLTRTGRDGDPPSSSSTPSVMAKMLEALDLRPGMRVLEIGAGTGYNAALINAITGATVVTVEAGHLTAADAYATIGKLGLADQVRVVEDDGYQGCPDDEPYDRIVVTCGIAGIPPGWLDQLAEGGLVVAPVAHAGVHPIMTAQRATDGLIGRALMWGDFMPAAGRLRPAHLFTHDPADDIAATRVRTIGNAGPALTLDGYHDLWFYLGVHDPRATRAYPDRDIFDLEAGTCALVDATVGAAWMHQDGTITTAGGLELGTYLATLVELWDSSDRPSTHGWRCTWTDDAVETAGLLLASDWSHAN